MNENEALVQSVISGIQEKKGKQIKVVDLNEIDDTICKYLVICEGGSPSQVSAIYDSVRETARKETGAKPTAVDGLRNCYWVAMDYIDVVVHIFVPDAREFYDLDNLWDDAKVTEIEDML